MGIDSAFQEAKMKMIRSVLFINLFLVFSLVAPLISSRAQGMSADFLGYLRGGTGGNFKGGKQECFYNAGTPANFLRLGNECDFYSEIGMVFHHKKAEPSDPVFFKTQMRLAFNGKGNRVYENSTNRDINQVEAFVTAGGFSEIPGDIWVGKRFYRDVDLFIFDWYYYAEMSGVGAGLENIPLKNGQFSVAHLIQTNETTQTSVGLPALQALDLRWKNISLTPGQKLNLWTVYASAPPSRTATANYQATQGASFSARLESQFQQGTNHFSLMYGQGAMKDFNLYGQSLVPQGDNTQNRAWNFRIVEDWRQDVADRWAVFFGLAAEVGDSGARTNSRREFQEMGVRPMYFVSDRFQWVFETGYSRIKDQAERKGPAALGERNLTRVTIAPQLSFHKSIWGRPVMRAFLSRSSWNRDNRSSVAVAAPSAINRLEGTSFGYQFEVWF